MKTKLYPIEQKKKWEYRKLIVEDERLEGWELSQRFGTYQSLPDVRENEFGGLVAIFRREIKK